MKKTALAGLLFLTISGSAQRADTSAKFLPPYKLSAYGFFDLVRLTGFGIDYRPKRWLEVDAQCGFYYTDGLFSKFINANDYFEYTGTSISLRVKFYFSKHFYFGCYGGFHKYGYNERWAVPDNTNDADAIRLKHLRELRDKHVTAYSPFGFTWGWREYLKTHWSLEEFIILSGESGGVAKERIYAGNTQSNYPADVNFQINRSVYPRYYGYNIIILVGVKVGYRIF